MKTHIIRPITATLSAIILLTLGACSSTDNSTSAQSANQSTTAQNTNSSPSNKPLFSDKNVAVAKNFKTTTVLQGLERPWGITWLPDGGMLITERPGRVRIVRNGKLDPNAIGGVPEIYAANQGGLMDVSVHPNFEKNRFVYFTYSHGTTDANRTRVARATFDGSTLKNWEVIFQVSQAKPGGQHFGSRIVWLPDNTMLVAIGDGGNPPTRLNGDFIRKQAQNLNSHFGKVVRLNDDGSIPKDNPFAASDSADKAIWSYGHRNIQGMTVDTVNNRLWSTEHGSRGGDELNLMEAGKNYGWPEVSYSDEYSGGAVSNVKSRPGVPEPKVVWTPSIAPSGLAFYSGDRFGIWKGDLFAGGLVSNDVRRIDLDANGNVLKEESIPIGRRVRDVRQSPDGGLYVLTDEQDGQLISIEPTES
ncbi:glucose/sorbosone dehydrogenase [Rivularia sp. PCC 7116]|uniref:PQQ-dependent sugar dehydrogenase n=1 Tax=Rivularia sp. PCC 7116 TaxID=373994 RepID=UPI00029F2483|nr:PQQ-dependent sugar dehydrogenase [Rivularia sp. PCC 7116]AFY58690.1 glucose/sorbosone dehydrogenase [Rivularia sp. PCC 7116]